jgi:hypothetical protein
LIKAKGFGSGFGSLKGLNDICIDGTNALASVLKTGIFLPGFFLFLDFFPSLLSLSYLLAGFAI